MTEKLTAEQFVQRWEKNSLNEQQGAHLHFLDLCNLLEEMPPSAETSDFYGFEKAAAKNDGRKGRTDVWKKSFFAWEYKAPNGDLKAAFQQLQRYTIALENPPLLVVSDMRIIKIYTNFNNTVQKEYHFELHDLIYPEKLQRLKNVFCDPEQLNPNLTQDEITEEFAREFAELAQQLRDQKFNPIEVAHFLNRVLLCLFAQDIGLLENHLFTNTLKRFIDKPERFVPVLKGLFQTMKTGGFYGTEEIEWFNGSLFDNDLVLPLKKDQIQKLYDLSQKDWKDISPSIFGTLFERGLDPDKRSQLGAHYTDKDSITRIVKPVIIEPLEQQWQNVKQIIQLNFEQRKHLKIENTGLNLEDNSREPYFQFIQQLKQLKILDPACGSGNFLYVAIQMLKDFEHRIGIEMEDLGLPAEQPVLTPEILHGIEINPYAAELALVTVWIGYLQWMLKHGYNLPNNPVLKDLKYIECRDALLNEDGSEAIWKEADFIIGNPPFLGNKKMIGILGETYVNQLRETFKKQLAGGVDLVCYWFAKAFDLIHKNQVRAVGLVATNSIRGGSNRKILEKICENGEIFNAWSDEEWVNDGAAVRVSIVCFNVQQNTQKYLNNQQVTEIYADLTAPNLLNPNLDLTKAKPLKENLDISFQGTTKVGAFDISGELARQWLKLPTNTNGCKNSDVLRPWANGRDITTRYSDTWIIDFENMSEEDASLYEIPFEYVLKNVKPERENDRRKSHKIYWWKHGETRPSLRKSISKLNRFIATPQIAKYRLFVWIDSRILSDQRLVVIAKDDDTTFGILHSRFHEIWSLRLGSTLEDRPTYTSTTTFMTFPFPDGLTPNICAKEYENNPHAQAISKAAKELDEKREHWLNPSDWIKREPEIVEGYPDRILPINEDAAKELKKRTLTNLYNLKPSWLINAHKKLDEAVANAYGLKNDLTDDDILSHLLMLNLGRVIKYSGIPRKI
jgi:type II restriction/modification system DNA methylase subunit YeeA